eukprot:1715911-Pleurochrysis_carterae.AAC.3
MQLQKVGTQVSKTIRLFNIAASVRRVFMQPQLQAPLQQCLCAPALSELSERQMEVGVLYKPAAHVACLRMLIAVLGALIEGFEASKRR